MDIFERILGIILPVFFIIAIGYAYGRLRGPAVRSDITAVNTVSMDLLSPLLVFTALAARDFDLAHNASLILGGAIISLGSGLLAWPVARFFRYDPRSFLPPMMYNNCGNMGLPLAVLAFGSAGLSAAVAMFMACNVIYFTIGIKIIESGRGNRTVTHWAFLKNPMILAMVIGILFALTHIPIPDVLFQSMKMLGDASIPIMLFALGVRMLDISFKSWHIGLVGAIVCPITGLFVAWGLDQVLNLTPPQRGQLFLFASLPPAVFCFMVAERYQQEPDKVASIVMLGNLASLAFVPLGLWMGLR
ncbi:AEC family transporter [Actimicrobium antarcticum]|uniref:AEC family transporter n=1 Tax=Actimicrobium antarcticum TaxID=1051899 RepID=A0ABP7TMJ2_9BURK